MSSNPAEVAGQVVEGDGNEWTRDYTANEPPLALVKPRMGIVPVVDFTPALDKPTKQLLIVPNLEACTAIGKVVSGVACVAWERAGTGVDLAPLLRREGRKVYIWLSNEHTSAWLAERTAALGYTPHLVPWPSDDVFASLLVSWDVLKAWVDAHKRPWQATRPVVDMPEMIDVLPDEAPPAPEALEMPASPPRRGAPEKEKVLRQARAELAKVAAEQEIALDPRVMNIDQWMEMGLHISNGKPTANVSNIALIFDVIKRGEIWYDEFLQAIMTQGGKGTRRWTDADDIRTTIEVQRRCGVPAAHKSIVADAVVEFAMRNIRNCLREWITSLVWDRIPRLEHALEDLFGVEPSDYHSEVGCNFFKSLAARAIWPGCKVDTMPTFEGPQGIGKSTVLEKLGGEWYAIMKESPDNKDFYIFMAGKWLIEIAELDSFSRADVKSVKRTLSTAVDRYRTPYGRHAEDHPRQCVFAGSTNRDDWNGDPTGARRFWPVSCPEAHPERAKANREQYFAEALHRLMHDDNKPSWWVFKDTKEVVRQQEARFVDDEWTTSVQLLIRGRNSISSAEIYRQLGFEEKEIGRPEQMRIANIMKRILWQRDTYWDGDAGLQRRCWRRLVAEGMGPPTE